MQNIFDELQLSNTKNLHKYHKGIDINALPLRVNKSLHAMEISPDSVFVLNDKPIILFFKKQDNVEKIFKQCWNFSESPIIIIENDIDFQIYNGYEYILKEGKFLLDSIKNKNINYISMMNGDYLKNIETSKYKNKLLNQSLLENIRNARKNLIDNNLSKEIANSLIGRVIFIRYLIDREIILNLNNEKKALTNDNLKNILLSKTETYSLFRYLKSNDGFNGDWFPILEDEENLVEIQHLDTLRYLISGTEIQTKQQSLFDIYDFSIIPIEFISNVYESFIGEDEQSKNGAYYTPTFLVDYILKHTMDEYFKNNPNEYNCRVLDPACGSGIFLVEALRKLISQFEKVTKDKILPEQIVRLVEENIFAIDKDKNAVLISVFSIYLTMLDYQNPKDIKDFKFPYLMKSDKNKSPNFFESDFFNTTAEYNEIIKNKNIHYIIGNPPYKRGSNVGLISEYTEQENIPVASKNIVQPFLARVKDFTNENTVIAFIITSKVFYNSSQKALAFRKYFLQNFSIKHILELSSISMNNLVFDNASVPVSLIFYTSGYKKDSEIDYISIKPHPLFEKLKTLFISKQDYKKILQSKLNEFDYLWKILPYGSYLDFNLHQRLKSYPTIKETLEKNGMKNGQGIMYTSAKSDYNDSSLYIGKKLVNLTNFDNFCIHGELSTFQEKFLHRVREQELFKPNILLLKEGFDNKTLRCLGAILYEEAIYNSTFTGIVGDTKSKTNILKEVLGILSSSLFSYLSLSSSGAERGQTHDTDKLNIPYIHNNKIVDIVSKIESFKNDYYSKGFSLENINENKIKNFRDNLDKEVLLSFELNEQEYTLIDYATNIIVPWVLQKNYSVSFGKIEYKDKLIEDYINIFIEHYSKIYEQNNLFFAAEIIYSDYAIGVKFNILDTKPSCTIFWSREDNIQCFLQLSDNQTMEQLFIQKDIKGFEENYFYVVKPNEYKNWHKAIGYLDFYEFDDAILEAGRK